MATPTTEPAETTVHHNGITFALRQNAARTDRQAWVIGTTDNPNREFDLVVDAKHGYVCNCSEYEAFATHHQQYLCEHGKALNAYLARPPVPEPRILTASVYFWHPAGNASGRRHNEQRNIAEVAAWFRSLGLTVRTDATGAWGQSEDHTLLAEFQYSESCNHIYRHLSVWRDGKKSNITALRKLA